MFMQLSKGYPALIMQQRLRHEYDSYGYMSVSVIG